MNHSWKNNICQKCGIKRKRKYWKLLMAITNHPPYDHYQTGTDWWYGNKHQFERPNCIRKKEKITIERGTIDNPLNLGGFGISP